MRLKFQSIRNLFTSVNWPMIIMFLGTAVLLLGRMTETLADPDLWGYMSFGRLFWTGAQFPYHDIFSYTPNKDIWVYHEWLTGVIFYPVFKVAGAAGLQGIKLMIGLFTAWFIYKTARLRGATAETAVICLVLVSPLFSFAYSPVRAQVFTNFFFVLTLYILEKTKHGHRRYDLLWLVPLFLFWSNLHGGFVAGLGIIGLFAFGESFSSKKAWLYWLALLASIFITLVNPYGLQYWIYLKDALLMPRPDIDEWHSVWFMLQNGGLTANIFILGLMSLIAVLMLATSKRRNMTDMIMIATTAFLAFKHGRHLSLFFLMMGCCAPLYFTEAWNTLRSNKPWKYISGKTSVVLIIVIFGFLCLFFGHRFISGAPFTLTLRNTSEEQATDYNYPVGAVEYIRKNGIKGNILPEFSWGEYISWNLPEIRVGMDGRYETVYTDQYSKEYFEFRNGKRGWRDFLNKYDHDFVLFQTDSTVSMLMHSAPDWVSVYHDRDCILYARKKQLK